MKAMKAYLRLCDGSEYHVGEIQSPIECFRCGICCTRYRPEVSLKEIEKIARKLGIAWKSFLSQYVRAVPTRAGYILQSSDDSCPFLRRDEKSNRYTCAIYTFRPQCCRDWVPSLSRPECREGLGRLGVAGKLLLPVDIYDSQDKVERLVLGIRYGRG
jgi:Fe-S-cluster containining protein